MDNSLVRELIDAGIHFGHRCGRWNPKMKPYIFCARNGIHIINIKETIKGLLRSKRFLASVVASGKDVLFVGTKRQARSTIVAQAQRSEMPFISERWLGGTLTNFATIRKRLGRLEELESMDENGLLDAQSKKMESTLRRQLRKIKRNLDGIRTMNKMPGALVIIDAHREHLAVAEARKLKIPTICLLDTDSDPDIVDIPIPGNDDAMRAIELIVSQLAESVMEGKTRYQEQQAAASATEAAGRRPRSRRTTTAMAAEQISPSVPAGKETPSPVSAPAEPKEPVQTVVPDQPAASSEKPAEGA